MPPGTRDRGPSRFRVSWALPERTPEASTTLQPASPRTAELDRLGDEIAELSAHLEAATARLLALIREFDARGGWNTGFRSCAAWLAWRVGLAQQGNRCWKTGSVLPDVPPLASVPADPVEALRARHAAEGHRLHPRTGLPRWLGEPLDVGWALDVLHPLATRAVPRRSMRSLAKQRPGC